jgi:hypothetical protein
MEFYLSFRTVQAGKKFVIRFTSLPQRQKGMWLESIYNVKKTILCNTANMYQGRHIWVKFLFKEEKKKARFDYCRNTLYMHMYIVQTIPSLKKKK